jgi:hypothetical protein
MSGFRFDLSQVPLVVVEYPDTIDETYYRVLFARYRELCAIHPRIAWLIDTQRTNPIVVTPRLRRVTAECFAESREALMRSTVCEARVVPNIAVRAVVVAFDTVTGTKWPTKNFSTRDAAERWCREQLAR